MSYDRTPILELVDAFEAVVGEWVTNTLAHAVLQDYNLEDFNLDRAIQHIEQNRQALVNPDGGITTENLAQVEAFLRLLKTFPNTERYAHWHDREDYVEHGHPWGEE